MVIDFLWVLGEPCKILAAYQRPEYTRPGSTCSTRPASLMWTRLRWILHAWPGPTPQGMPAHFGIPLTWAPNLPKARSSSCNGGHLDFSGLRAAFGTTGRVASAKCRFLEDDSHSGHGTRLVPATTRLPPLRCISSLTLQPVTLQRPACHPKPWRRARLTGASHLSTWHMTRPKHFVWYSSCCWSNRPNCVLALVLDWPCHHTSDINSEPRGHGGSRAAQNVNKGRRGMTRLR